MNQIFKKIKCILSEIRSDASGYWDYLFASTDKLFAELRNVAVAIFIIGIPISMLSCESLNNGTPPRQLLSLGIILGMILFFRSLYIFAKAFYEIPDKILKAKYFRIFIGLLYSLPFVLVCFIYVIPVSFYGLGVLQQTFVAITHCN